ncbi:MAG: hypothetical protein D6820_11830 [Lentisphaerae bacterium]|nr:MAG: hypothetical protein D6820_11830 [Lentisphaerota bacterium]
MNIPHALVLGLVINMSASMFADNLIKNSGFNTGPHGQITAWSTSRDVTVQTIDGVRTLTVRGRGAAATQTMRIPVSVRRLRIQCRYRSRDVTPDKSAWKTAKLILLFRDKEGNRIGKPQTICHARDTSPWKHCSRELDVPQNATAAEVTITNLGISGQLEVQQLVVQPVRPLRQDPSGKPVIILKLDDFTRLTPNWRRVVEFLKEQRLKAGLGIIGGAWEKADPQFVQWCREQLKTGLFEIWNHGYYLRKAGDKLGEFESDSWVEQKKALLRTQQLAAEKLGVELRAFGPHWSSTNEATIKALQQVPQIKMVFFYTRPGYHWFVFKRFMNLEHPTFVPNLEYFRQKYATVGRTKPYLALQGHPNAWNGERWENFKKIIAFLRQEGCRFMTPSEYYETYIRPTISN